MTSMTLAQNQYPDPGSRIIIALDLENIDAIYTLINQLEPSRCRLKIGLQLFVRFGPAFVEKIVAKGFDVFLDLKFHDIPMQVANACKAAADLNIWMLTVHALGGQLMLEAARNSLEKISAGRRPLLVGVTLLTSLQESELPLIGLERSIKNNIERFAQLLKSAGFDGAVCSAHETQIIRQLINQPFCLVTPGIRLASDDKHDQKRFVTPEQAIKMGSDFLVVGRSITQASNPLAVIAHIEKIFNFNRV